MAAGFRLGSIKASWQDASVIHNQGITWLKLVNNIVKMFRKNRKRPSAKTRRRKRKFALRSRLKFHGSAAVA